MVSRFRTSLEFCSHTHTSPYWQMEYTKSKVMCDGNSVDACGR